MRQRFLFDDLPATFPVEDQFRRHATFGSLLVHSVIFVTAIVTPLMLTPRSPDLRLLIYMAPPPPPPGPITLAAPREALAPATKVEPAVRRRSEASLIAPLALPKDIALITDVSALSSEETDSVPGGMPGGIIPGFLRDAPALPLLPRTTETFEAPAPPPPRAESPKPQESPVRLTAFDAFKPVRSTPPMYPRVAKLARIQGTVFLDVTLDEAGNVEEVRIVSGHPLLAQAAVDCVKDWLYEPPKIDGKPLRVTIPVRLNFRLQL